MDSYIWIAAGLNFAVNLLLLLAANKTAGGAGSSLRLWAAAAMGALFAALCLLPGFHFLGTGLWKFVCLALLCLLAFGPEGAALRKSASFCFYWTVMGGLAAGFVKRNAWGGILLFALLALLYLNGFGGDGRDYIPVTIHYRGKTSRLTALRDTGNLLQDPVTGQDVLIVDPGAARALLGLTPDQLLDPVTTVASGNYPGLRLIPYHSLGQPGGLLLALRFEDVTVGQQSGPKVIAFAPNFIGGGSRFQALAGGMA